MLLAKTKESRPLGEIRRLPSTSYSGYSLYACSETIIELECVRIIKRNQDFLVHVFDSVQRVQNARGLGKRLLICVTNKVTKAKLRSYDLSVSLLTHNS